MRLFSARRLRGPAPRRAFTLVEVMATLVLLAVILPVAMKGIALAVRTAGVARERMEATALAETKLGELLATEAWRNGPLGGDFGAERPQYDWTAEVSDWEGSVLRLLTLRVEWISRGQMRIVALSTIVYTGAGSDATSL